LVSTLSQLGCSVVTRLRIGFKPARMRINAAEEPCFPHACAHACIYTRLACGGFGEVPSKFLIEGLVRNRICHLVFESK
jgi:hypothetical protein